MDSAPREWRAAILALVAMIVVLVLPLLARGEVVYPDDGRTQLGLETETVARNLGDRRLGDVSNYYVPEAHHHLHGDSTRWMSVWNPHVELGRPSSHLAGVSPAYLPARVLGWFVHDAFWFHTWLALGTIAATAAFLFLFLRAIDLSAWACFAGAAGLATGSFALYWAPFPIFTAGLCWTAACLWLVARWLRRPTIAVAIGLAFSTYALLLSAYPQQIVWHAWIVAGFAVGRWWRAPHREFASLLGIAACALIGLAAAAPVYADLALQASRSARVDVDSAFFLASLPHLEGVRDTCAFLASMVDAFLTTDPYSAGRARDFNGASLAPAFAGFVGLAFASGALRRAAGWLAFSALALLLTVWPAAYLFGVEHLGLSISRFRPQAAALIPLAVAGAIGVDALLRDRARSWVVPLTLALAPLVFAACFSQDGVSGARWIELAGVGVGLAALTLLRWRALVPVLALASLFFWSAPLLISIPRAAIAEDSPLLEAVRARTADGSRFAIAGARQQQILPPNQEARFGLHSVHSYDSLSPDSYRAWCAAVSNVGAQVRGRWFQFVAGTAGFARPEFSQADVGLVLSREPVASPDLVEDGRVGPWRLLRPVRAPVPLAHVVDVAASALKMDEVTLGGHVQDHARSRVDVVERHDDLLRVRIEPRNAPTLLFTATQHDPHWRARADDGSELRTVLVDGTFLGVALPAGCDEITLRFEPWAVWAWIPQLAFAVAGAIASWIALRARGAVPAT